MDMSSTKLWLRQGGVWASGRLGLGQLNGEVVQRSRYNSFQENGVVAVELDMQLLGDRIVFIRNS